MKKSILFLTILASTMLFPVIIDRSIGESFAPKFVTQGAGPTWTVNIKLQDGADVLPPGPAEHSKKIQCDEGSDITALSNATAIQLGLLKADGTDNGFQSGTVTGEDAAGKIMGEYYISKQLTMLVQGKKCDCNPWDANYKSLPGKQVVYPKKNATYTGPDIADLWGKDAQANLGKGAQPTAKTTWETTTECAVSVFDQIPQPGQGKQVKPQEEEKKPPHGQQKRVKIRSITVNEIPADFYVVGGSPYTIIGQSLATSLGLTPIGYFDMYNLNKKAFDILVQDAFFNFTLVSPGPLPVVEITTFKIPTVNISKYIVFTNVEALINPFSNDNVMGTNLFLINGYATTFDYYNLVIAYGMPIPSRPSVGGISVPVAVDKLGLLAPYIGLASTILVATVATSIYVKHVKRRKEK